MNKIPIKIVELSSPSGQTAIDVMIDVYDFEGIENPQQKIKEFKKKYFELIEKTKKIMPEKRDDKLPSVYWKIGHFFKKFNRPLRIRLFLMIFLPKKHRIRALL